MEVKLASIYKIINLINNKIYIGSTNNFKKRKNEHLYSLRNNNHFNKHLQLAYNKYGESIFKFEIIEYINSEDKLLEREQYWIDKLGVCNGKRKTCGGYKWSYVEDYSGD